MSFALEAIVDNVSYSLSDGNPFALEQAEGMGLAPIRRLGERGPFQDGRVDLGYRLDPRTVTLTLNFKAATDSALDAHRATFYTIFRAQSDIPILLRATRDDGNVRQLTCYTVGAADVPLVTAQRPEHLHRAVVQLRAADSTWTDVSPTVETFFSGGWWLAQGSIDASNVLEYVEEPTVGQLYNGGSATDAWTIAIRSTDGVNAPRYVFDSENGRLVIGDTFGGEGYYNGTAWSGISLFDAAPTVVFLTSNGGTIQAYKNNVAVGAPSVSTVDIGGTTRWRDNYAGSGATWQTTVTYGAVYDIALDDEQRASLYRVMEIDENPDRVIWTVNQGDLPAWPVITLRGPVTGAIITNTASSATLNFGTHVIAETDIYTVDLRPGHKSIYDHEGNNKLNELSDPTALQMFRIEPSPIASGGTNVITLAGSAITTTTTLTVEHTNHYLSF